VGKKRKRGQREKKRRIRKKNFEIPNRASFKGKLPIPEADQQGF
jgi:hypothetical protein